MVVPPSEYYGLNITDLLMVKILDNDLESTKEFRLPPISNHFLLGPCLPSPALPSSPLHKIIKNTFIVSLSNPADNSTDLPHRFTLAEVTIKSFTDYNKNILRVSLPNAGIDTKMTR